MQRRLVARNAINDYDLDDVTRAYVADELCSRSKSSISDFKSVRTPATMLTGKSGISYQHGRNTSLGNYAKEGVNTKTWYRKNAHLDSTMQPNDLKSEIFSNFSKKTNQTFESIRSRTQSRLVEDKRREHTKVIESLRNNEFIPNETLE